MVIVTDKVSFIFGPLIQEFGMDNLTVLAKIVDLTFYNDPQKNVL